MIILYSLQGEKGDDPLHPNAFYIKTNSETEAVTLAQISSNFPLAHVGTFHFRFRIASDNIAGVKGWIYVDITDPNSEVPTFNGSIMLKALRTDKFNRLGGSSVGNSISNSNNTTTNNNNRTSIKTNPVSNPTTTNNNNTTASTTKIKRKTSDEEKVEVKKPVVKEVHESNDLDDFFAGSGSPKKIDTNSTNSVSSSAYSSPKNKSTNPRSGIASPALASLDIDEDEGDGDKEGEIPMSALKPYLKQINKKDPKFEGKSTFVRDAMIRHEATVLYNADLAVQKKVDRDAAVVHQQDDMDAAQSMLGPKLTAWAEEKGTKKAIRALLASLHTILWEGSGWKEVNMGDLIMAPRVTFHYKKAMLRVHPDKNMDRTPDQQFIAARAFDALNQAYSVFEAGGMV